VTNAFAVAARAAVQSLTREHVEVLARQLKDGATVASVSDAVALPAYVEAATGVLNAIRETGTDREAAAIHLRALAEGYTLGRTTQRVEVVWSGPTSSAVPVRATAQVLTDLINEAKHELILMTYSAWPYQPLTKALSVAVGRGVGILAVVETLAGAGGALAGEEPAAAFAAVSGMQVWHWPSAKRTEHSSKMHAKLAVADKSVLFVSSANLTQSGIGKNIEAGLLVRGGPAPARAAEHVQQLQACGALDRLC
jgi:phosphatidylserine/phosphatidylglycerophosphate/cardiolipin synthase-like enzyme